jgi:mannose-6-phosphate isomerase-like protein (cupin superfamily)
VTARGFSFDRALFEVAVAHGGAGSIMFSRVLERPDSSSLLFIDLAVVPPGSSIGLHRHSDADEELYVIVEGRGTMTVDGVELDVGPGDVVVNQPGGTHGLENLSDEPLRMVVVDFVAPGHDTAAIITPDDVD